MNDLGKSLKEMVSSKVRVITQCSSKYSEESKISTLIVSVDVIILTGHSSIFLEWNLQGLKKELLLIKGNISLIL